MRGSEPRSSPSAKADFDRVARVYRWAELLTMGPTLRRAREHFLPAVAQSRFALILGDGDGRFAAALLARAPHLRGVAVDSSSAMLTLLRRRCSFAGDRLRTVQASLPVLPVEARDPSPDLVVTHFVLDCLTQVEVERLAVGLATKTQPGCLWVLSDFAIPSRAPWKWLGSACIRSLYFVFRVLTGLRVWQLPAWEPALTQAGFHRLQRWSTLRGLLTSELWQKRL